MLGKTEKCRNNAPRCTITALNAENKLNKYCTEIWQH